MLKKLVTGLAVGLVCLTPAMAYAGHPVHENPPTPPPAGPVFASPAIGQTVTYEVPANSAAKASNSGVAAVQAPGSPSAEPTQTVTISAQPFTATPLLADGTVAAKADGVRVDESADAKVPAAAAAAAAAGCNTATFKVSWNSLLWVKMS